MTGQATLLTIQEAATTLRLSVSTIRRAIRLGQLHVVRPVGRRRLLVPARALEAFLYGAPLANRGLQAETAVTASPQERATPRGAAP